MTPETSRITVDFKRPERDNVFSALYTIHFVVTAAEDFPEGARFVLSLKNAGVIFRKDLVSTGGSQAFWLAVNTHLLPNGINDIEIAVEAAGQRLFGDTFSITVLNDGPLADRVRQSLRRRSAPLVFDGLVDAESFDTSETLLLPWYDRPGADEHIDSLEVRGEISPEDARDLRFLVANGYVQLATSVEPEAVAAANAAIDDAVAKKNQGYQYGTSQRIEHMHDHYEAIRYLWRHPVILKFLRLVFDIEPLPCQTLTYVFGSQQDVHQDTVHLTSFPSGYMCGVWIALEDIQPDSGELVVVPKSHRFERVYRKSVGCSVVKDNKWEEFGSKVVRKWKDMYEQSGLPLETYRPRAGSILIWLDSLLHGGSIRKDLTLTRRSIVSHYFASGSIAYYDSTGLPGYVHR